MAFVLACLPVVAEANELSSKPIWNLEINELLQIKHHRSCTAIWTVARRAELHFEPV